MQRFWRHAVALGAALVSGSASRRRVPILTFHRVLPAQDTLQPAIITRDEFEMLVRIIADSFRPLTFADALHGLATRTLPSRAVVITFDDGYEDNVTVALPTLERYGVPATFFVTSGLLDGTTMFNDQIIEIIRGTKKDELSLQWLGLGVESTATNAARGALLERVIDQIKYRSPTERAELVARLSEESGFTFSGRLMMRPAQLRSLVDAGMEVGGHTISHPILTALSDSDAASEIGDCRDALQAITGQNVTTFAYPNGYPGVDYTQTHVDLVKRAGYVGAAATTWACATPASDPFEIPRVGVRGRSSGEVSARLLRSYLY